MRQQFEAYNQTPIVLAVTGHRDLRAEDLPQLHRQVQRILQELQSTYPTTPLILLSPLAEGADRLVAEAALECNVRLYVPLPMPYEEYIKDFESPESREEFESLRSRATCEYVVDLPSHLRPVVNRNLYYENIGVYIASHSQILIALWDGKEGKPGGTASVVGFKRNGIPEKYWSKDDPLLVVDSGMVYHIVTPRKDQLTPNGEPFSVRIIGPADQPAWEVEFQKILMRIERLNRDIKRRRPKITDAKIEEVQNYTISAQYRKKLPSSIQFLLHKYILADQLAVYFRDWRLWMLQGVLGMGVTLVLLFLFYDELEQNGMLFVYLGVFILAYLSYFIAERRDLHNKHLEYRALAEGLRVQLFWKIAGVEKEVEDQYIHQQRVELQWSRYVLMNTNLECKMFTQECMALDDRFPCVLEDWVTSQVAYFQSRTNQTQRSLQRWNRFINALFIINFCGFLLITCLEYAPGRLLDAPSLVQSLPQNVRDLLFPQYEHIVWRNWAKVLLGTMAALIAVISNYIDKVAYPEQSKRYYKMYHLYHQADIRLKKALHEGRSQEVKKILEYLGEQALTENGDWVLLFKERPIEVPK